MNLLWEEFSNTFKYGQGHILQEMQVILLDCSCENDGNSQMFQCKVMMGESDIGREKYELTSGRINLWFIGGWYEWSIDICNTWKC